MNRIKKKRTIKKEDLKQLRKARVKGIKIRGTPDLNLNLRVDPGTLRRGNLVINHKGIDLKHPVARKPRKLQYLNVKFVPSDIRESATRLISFASSATRKVIMLMNARIRRPTSHVSSAGR